MSGLRVERFDGFDWGELAVRSTNVFATPEFLELWWRHFGRGERRFVALRRGDELVAVVPLYARRVGPLRVLRFVGHGAGDELGPICAAGERDEVRAALPDALRAAGPWDVLLAEQLPGDAGYVAGRTLQREGSPLIRFEESETWDILMASWSSKLRRDLRQDERKLTANHDLRFRLADDPERLPADLDLLFALHRTRWAESEFAQREPFHREFAALALERGWLRLWFVELEGKAAAVWHGFRFAGVESHYQVGRDPGWNRFGIGTLVSGHTIREAVADGLREYRFLRGDESYKYRFAREDPGLETVVAACGALGSAAVAAGRGALGLRRRLRRRPG